MSNTNQSPKRLWDQPPKLLTTQQLQALSPKELLACLNSSLVSMECQFESLFISLQDLGSILPTGHTDAHIQTCGIPLRYFHLCLGELLKLTAALEEHRLLQEMNHDSHAH